MAVTLKHKPTTSFRACIDKANRVSDLLKASTLEIGQFGVMLDQTFDCFLPDARRDEVTC